MHGRDGNARSKCVRFYERRQLCSVLMIYLLFTLASDKLSNVSPGLLYVATATFITLGCAPTHFLPLLEDEVIFSSNLFPHTKGFGKGLKLIFQETGSVFRSRSFAFVVSVHHVSFA